MFANRRSPTFGCLREGRSFDVDGAQLNGYGRMGYLVGKDLMRNYQIRRELALQVLTLAFYRFSLR